MTNTPSPAEPVYGKQYFDTFGGQGAYVRENPKWLEHFGRLAEGIVERYAPKRVLDVGCAKGFLVEKLRDLGVEAFGVDVSEYAISEVREDIRPFCRAASAAEPLGERYDLITWIEVAEHMPEEDARRAVANVCAHADQVLFSSTPSDFGDDTHLCVKPPEFWTALFAEQGLYTDLRFDPTFITPHAVRFVRCAKERPHVVVFSNEQSKHAVVRLRLLSPLQALEREGRMRVTFVSKDDADADVDALLGADVFVIHREFSQRRLSERVVTAARAAGKPVVVELDDLLTQVPRSNPNYVHCLSVAPDLVAMLRDADFVTVSTPRLKTECEREEPAARGKTFVLENSIDPEVWGREAPSPRTAGSPLVIGWMGSPTHDEDLAVAKTAIAYVLRKHAGRVVFRTWGYMPADLSGIPGAELARGAQPDVQKHAADLRKSGIDFAIAPLADLPFNHSKSNLKWLEYSVCGIPGIYSAVTPYASTIVNGLTGLVVENTTEAWVAALERMIADEDLRIRIARNATVEVSERCHLDQTAGRWDSLYRSFVVSAVAPAAADAATADARRASAHASLLVDSADRLLKRGHFERAIERLELAARTSPDQAVTIQSFAATLSKQGRDSAAERLLVAVAETAEDPRPAIVALAHHRVELGDPLRAEEALHQALAAIPRDEQCLTELVDLLARTGQNAEASRLLRQLGAEMESPTEMLALTNLCVKVGRAADALHVVRSLRKRFASMPEIAESTKELEATLAGAVPADAAANATTGARAMRVAVLTSEPLATERACVRLRSPLGILEQRGEISTSWTDGRRHTGCVERADLVVVQGELRDDDEARVVVERAAQLGKPVVLELDSLSSDGAWFMGRAAAITVPTAELRDALARIEPTLKPRLHVLPDTIDLALWHGRTAIPSIPNRPLTLALLSDGCESPRARAVVEALLDSLDAIPDQAVVAVFGPLPADLAARPSVRRVCDDMRSYRELALALLAWNVDLAIVPPSSSPDEKRANDLRWLQCAASRVPCVLSSTASSMPEIVHGRTAWLATDAPSSWVQGVATLASQETTRRHIANAAWTVATGERSAQQHAARWLTVYRALLAAPAVGGPSPSSAPVAVGAASGPSGPTGKGKRSKPHPSGT